MDFNKLQKIQMTFDYYTLWSYRLENAFIKYLRPSEPSTHPDVGYSLLPEV